MYFFNHAQPALLYLVPCTLFSSTLTAFQAKEFNELWKFNEEKLDKEEDDDDDEVITKKEETKKENGETKKKVE